MKRLLIFLLAFTLAACQGKPVDVYFGEAGAQILKWLKELP